MRKRLHMQRPQSGDYLKGYQDGYRDGFKRGHSAGIVEAARLIDKYCLPAWEDLQELQAIGTYMAGVVNNAYRVEFTKTIIKQVNEDLGAQMSKVLNTYAIGRGAGLNLPNPDLSRAENIHQAALKFLESGDATELRDLFSQYNNVFIAHQDLRLEENVGGRPNKMSDDQRRLAEMAIQIKERDGTAYWRVGVKIMKSLDEGDSARELIMMYFSDDGKTVKTDDQRRRLGKYLSELVTDYNKNVR